MLYCRTLLLRRYLCSVLCVQHWISYHLCQVGFVGQCVIVMRVAPSCRSQKQFLLTRLWHANGNTHSNASLCQWYTLPLLRLLALIFRANLNCGEQFFLSRKQFIMFVQSCAGKHYSWVLYSWAWIVNLFPSMYTVVLCDEIGLHVVDLCNRIYLVTIAS